MPDLLTITIALVAVIISIGSFYYGRKPLIYITSKDIGKNYLTPTNYKFTIKNVSQNPAKDILVEVKLIHNEIAHNIGDYELDYLTPEAEDVISDISNRIESKLEELKILDITESIDPFFYRSDFIDDDIKILEKYYEDNEFQTICSYIIDNDFKINIEFKITCRAHIPISTIDKFRYNFELSYIKYDLENMDLIKHEHEKALAISYGYEDNFFLIMKPSNGKWK